jgi:hypothetical protein
VDAVFRIDGDRVLTSPLAAGPWDPSLQHGSAPAALVAWAADSIPCEPPMQVARLTIDFLRPIPIAPLEVRTEVVRQGRKIQLCCVRLFAADMEVLRASALKVRIAAFTSDLTREEPLDLPSPEWGRDPVAASKIRSGFLEGVTMTQVAGDLSERGSAAIWFRIDRMIIDDVPLSPLMRAAIVADFCNGTSAIVDIERYTYINADTTLRLTRMPIGDWILLDACTSSASTGVGVASARLADRHGYFGRAAQTILLEQRN